MSYKKSLAFFSLLAIVFAGFPTSFAHAAEPELLKDINTQPRESDSFVQYLKAANGSLYFAGTNEFGSEPFISDGTQEGTMMLKDIHEGAGSSFSEGFTEVGGEVFFVSDDDVNGSELWKTNGTEEGTVMVKDINPGAGNSITSTSMFIEFNNEFYFSATDGASGSELWKSDGTEVGTVMVKDISPGAGNAMTSQPPIVFNGELYFYASNGINGNELWKTDGTEVGTVMVADINTGGNNSAIDEFTIYNGELFFIATDGITGFEIWKTDGAMLGTVRVSDINVTGNSFPYDLTAGVDALYFFADDGSATYDLWKTDGTELGTELAADLDPDANGLEPSGLRLAGTDLFFILNDFGGWVELWKSDGTEVGTELVLDVNPDFNYAESEQYLTIGGLYYFTLLDYDGYTSELWVSDGTALGTMQLDSYFADWDYSGGYSVQSLVEFNGEVYFDGGDREEDFDFFGQTGDIDLWKTDGTEVGTEKVADTYLLEVNFSSLETTSVESVELNGELYFAANDGQNGKELWKTDGTEVGTVMVKDIYAGAQGSQVTSLFATEELVYFSANTADSGQELWKTDGTEVGTVMVRDIYVGAQGSAPRQFVELEGVVYFVANDAATGLELWKTDGTEGGTEQVIDLRAGAIGASPTMLTVSNGVIFFVANDGVASQALWKTDGTEGGTEMVVDIVPGADEFFADLVAYSGGIFFQSRDGLNSNNELWKSDGTELGTVQVKDIDENPAISSSARRFIVLNDRVYFSANDRTNGVEMWTSDGTEEGTVMVANTNGADDSNPSQAFLFNDEVYFVSFHDDNATLMRTDATEENAEQIAILQESVDQNNYDVEIGVATEDEAYFDLTYSSGGDQKFEIWKTDGTEEGTSLLQDAANDGISEDEEPFAYPGSLAVFEDVIFYSAYTVEEGVEPWIYQATTAYVPRGDDGGGGGGGTSTPSQSLVVVVDSPNGGERLLPGSFATIRYSSNASAQFANILYSTNNGSTWTTIAQNVQASGSYNWQVPNVQTGEARVKVEFTDLATVLASDTSDAVFAIGDAEIVNEEEIDFEPRLPEGTPENGMAPSPANGQMQRVSEVAPGQFIKSPAYDTVYFVNQNLERQPFLNEMTFATYADSFDQVLEVTDATLPLLPMAAPMLPKAGVVLVKTPSVNEVYAVQSTNIYTQPVKRWIPSEEIATALYGADWADFIIDIPPTSVHLYQTGTDMNASEQIDRDIMKKRGQLTIQE